MGKLEDMFSKRAEQNKKWGDVDWAKAKNGEGEHHYSSAKKLYDSAEQNKQKAEEMRKKGK